MPQPQDCQTLEEVRSEIDRLDKSIIEIISRRQEYVYAAAQFKSSAAEVHALERQRRMIESRRNWAESLGVDPDLAAKLFRTVVDHFIQEEMTVFSGQRESESIGKSMPTSSAVSERERFEEDGS